MLGTILTPHREKTKLYGFVVHVGAGWLFSLFYVLIFESLGAAGWWRGAVIGVLRAVFVLVVVMALLAGLHPRMASEQHVPTARNMLEPPGFLALNYGFRTPLAVLLSHAVFGTIFGSVLQSEVSARSTRQGKRGTLRNVGDERGYRSGCDFVDVQDPDRVHLMT